jgi:hypothetical protein
VLKVLTELFENIRSSQLAVNRRKRSAGWNAVSALLDRYEELMDNLIQK